MKHLERQGAWVFRFLLVLKCPLFFVVWQPWSLKLTDFHVHRHHSIYKTCFFFKISRRLSCTLPNATSLLWTHFLENKINRLQWLPAAHMTQRGRPSTHRIQTVLTVRFVWEHGILTYWLFEWGNCSLITRAIDVLAIGQRVRQRRPDAFTYHGLNYRLRSWRVAGGCVLTISDVSERNENDTGW